MKNMELILLDLLSEGGRLFEHNSNGMKYARSLESRNLATVKWLNFPDDYVVEITDKGRRHLAMIRLRGEVT